MAIDIDKDRAVVVISKGEITVPVGFPHLYSAIALVERQVVKSELAFDTIVEAMDKGTEVDGVTYRVMDVDVYIDTYEDYDQS